MYTPANDEAGTLEQRPIEDLTGEIRLRDALSLALLQSPELAAFAWEVRAQEAAVLQAGRLPNPVITTLIQDLAGRGEFSPATDPIQTQATVELSQLIELGGKRAARQRLATANRDAAAWDYEIARIDVLTRVTQAYLDVLASQQAVSLAEQNTSVSDQVRQTVGLRVAAGVVSPIEETRADVALAAVRIEADRARRALDEDRRRLAALWGSREPRFESAAGDLGELPPVPTFEVLHERLSQNPELARWAAAVAQREAALDVERSKRIPDIAVIGGYRRYPELNRNAFVLGASVQVPLFNRNQDAVQESRARLTKVHEEQRAAEARVTSLLAEAYRALASARDEVAVLASTVLPGSRSTFEAVGEGYRLGRFGYLEVLDAQRTLVGAGGQYVRMLAEYHKAAAEIERLIGEPLREVAGASEGFK
ncbi:MAG: TolC family protein [Vicinamibacterales bacterium]